ncbi:MAG TPA: PilZ domain-containing protein [Phycisphaerae bacterium]|nr:PilZ domain-containing protein [Phycisphaerae bacterium]
MAQAGTVVRLNRENLPIFLSIFGDMVQGTATPEARRVARRTARCAFEFIRTHAAGDAEILPAWCVDISEAGLGFVCREPLLVGEIIEVYLPGESQEYLARVRVIHARPSKGRYRCGGVFVWD